MKGVEWVEKGGEWVEKGGEWENAWFSIYRQCTCVRIVTIYSKCLAFSGQKVPFWRSWNKMAVWLH